MISAVLNKKIIIEKSTITKDAIGSPVKTWTEYLETWAGVYTPYRNVEFNDREQLVYTTEFTIRYNNKTKYITNKYRVKYNDNYYKINQIVPLEDKIGIRLITTMFDDE